MLIVSKFRDYYDNVASMGVDKTVVYNRGDEKEIELSLDLSAYPHEPFTGYGKTAVYPLIISFCGEKFLGLKSVDKSDHFNTKIDYIWTDIEQALIDIDKKREKLRSRIWTNTRSDIMDFFNIVDLNKYHIEFNTPIVMYKESNRFHNTLKIITNVNLSNVKFYRAVDTFSAFQQIQQFISGVLGSPAKNTIEISNKDRIEGHGFDYNSSFRKQVDTRKRKQRKKH